MKYIKPQKVVFYNCEKKQDESFENMEFRIPKIINSDIAFQLIFGFEYNVKEDRNLMNKHHKRNQKMELNEQFIYNN